MADQKISTLTNYTPPLDADVIPIVDTANTTTKKVSWANIKATLKTYLDTLYPSGSGTSTGTNTGDQTISDATITTTDVTTNNFTTSKHGFVPKGTNVGNFLKDDGTFAAVSPVNASTTVKGVVEEATASEITAGTAAGGTGAELFINPAALASSSPTFNGTNLTNILLCKNGATTHDMSSSTATTIAHGLGKTPSLVKVHVNRATASASGITGSLLSSIGSYDGSSQNCNYVAVDSNGAVSMSAQDTSNGVHYGYGAAGTADTDKLTGVITFDATNITITWTKTNSPTGTGNIHWEAIGH